MKTKKGSIWVWILIILIVMLLLGIVSYFFIVYNDNSPNKDINSNNGSDSILNKIKNQVSGSNIGKDTIPNPPKLPD